MLYKTIKGLRKAVEKKYGRHLADNTWEMVKPEDNPPYTEFDMEDSLEGIRDYKPKKMKRKSIFKSVLKSIKTWTRPVINAIDFRPQIRFYRKHELGLKRPIPIEKNGSHATKHL